MVLFVNLQILIIKTKIIIIIILYPISFAVNNQKITYSIDFILLRFVLLPLKYQVIL
jgi:hypothetical protein